MLTSLYLHMKSKRVCIKTRSTPASLPLKGQVTKHTTVKRTITSHCSRKCAHAPQVPNRWGQRKSSLRIPPFTSGCQVCEYRRLHITIVPSWINFLNKPTRIKLGIEQKFEFHGLYYVQTTGHFRYLISLIIYLFIYLFTLLARVTHYLPAVI